MAPSSQDSVVRPWPWGQHHHVDSDDRFKCCLARSRFSHWVTIADCKHSCIGIHEFDGGSCIDIVATCGRFSLYRSLYCDRFFDCDSSALDHNARLVCIHIVACSTNSQIVDVKTQQSSWVSCLDGDDFLEHCVPAGVGGVLHFVGKPRSYWHHHSGPHWCGDGGVS